MRRLAWLVRSTLPAALLLGAAPTRAEVQPLHVDPRWDVPVTASAALLAIGLSSSYAAPARCRMCGAGSLDTDAREDLRWRNPASARLDSDTLANLVLPAAVLANSAVFSHVGGEPRAFWEDSLVIAEAVSLTAAADAVAKDATARRRPSAGPTASGSADRSFFSGHASQSFALVAASGTVSTLRGYPSAPWVWAGGLTMASAVGYLRIAGDAHWTTDVVAGAAVGGLVGFAVPWFFHRAHPASGVALVPAPGGIALEF